jgi:hypothetical protein
MASYEAALKSVERKTGKPRVKVPTSKGKVAAKSIGPAKNVRVKAKPKGRVDRLTSSWPDSTGKEVPVKATVSWDGKQWTVRGRFTMKPKTGELVPALGLAPKSGKGKGKHVAAKDVTLAR